MDRLNHSGAAAQVFNIFKEYVPNNVNISAIQYPGRGHNISEPLIYHINGMITALYHPILEVIQIYKNVYFYGHSLGALIAYELLKQYQRNQINIGHCILNVGACPSPDLIGRREHLHCLSDDKFWEKIKEYGGTPEIVLEDNDFKRMFLPILKADFTIYETYSTIFCQNEPLSIPIKVFVGQFDKIVNLNELTNWKNETTKQFKQFIFEGDHFFMSKNSSLLVKAILAKV